MTDLLTYGIQNADLAAVVAALPENRVAFDKRAVKAYKALDRETRQRVAEVLVAFCTDPRTVEMGSAKAQLGKGGVQLRATQKWRVLAYRAGNQLHLVDIASRGDKRYFNSEA